MAGISIRKMAAELGVGKSQVQRDAAAGMPMASVEAARAWRAATHDVSRTKEGRIDRSGEQTSAPADDEPGNSDADTAAYRRERAERERIRREREQLELDELRGQLVDAAEVSRLQFTAQRLTRDRLEMVAARAAPDLVALLKSGGDGFAVERMLAQHIRQSLEDAAKAIDEIDSDDDAAD